MVEIAMGERNVLWQNQYIENERLLDFSYMHISGKVFTLTPA